jgi:hypothetical protein
MDIQHHRIVVNDEDSCVLVSQSLSSRTTIVFVTSSGSGLESFGLVISVLRGGNLKKIPVGPGHGAVAKR